MKSSTRIPFDKRISVFFSLMPVVPHLHDTQHAIRSRGVATSPISAAAASRGRLERLRVAGGSRALGYVRPHSGLVAHSYGEERQLLFDTRVEESMRIQRSGIFAGSLSTECRVSSFKGVNPPLRFLQPP